MELTKFDQDEEMLTLYYDGTTELCTGEPVKFPFVWLRDNCRCPECIHPTSGARSFMFRYLDPEVKPKHIEIQDKTDLVITWPDEHTSVFTFPWLQSHGFTEEAKQVEEDDVFPQPRLWVARDLQDQIPRVNYDQYMADDHVVLKFVNILEQEGICLLEGAPTEKGAEVEIAGRTAFLQRTTHGDKFIVKSQPMAKSLAYTSETLGFHTDHVFEHTPGIQCLHCRKQACDGGENIFADGYKVAEDMQVEDPNAYKLLTEMPIQYKDLGGVGPFPFIMKRKTSFLECDREGRLFRIRGSFHTRDVIMSMPVEKVKPYYKAMKLYEDMLMSPTYKLVYKLKPGEVVCFDNYRVFHGREAFVMQGESNRWLEGFYMGWDEVRSRRRQLLEQFSK